MTKKWTRRNVLIGATGLCGAAIFAGRESDNSGPRDPYFLAMQSALKAKEIARPTLIIDLERLDANIDMVLAEFPEGMGYRLPSKSLPSLPLINHVLQKAGSNRVMTFNGEMLREISQSRPDCDQLLGKPLPVTAMKNYFLALSEEAAAAAANVQWLIDTPERLDQYIAVAEAEGLFLRVNIELDVGLHRGGFVPGHQLLETLTRIQDHPRLTFSGFMGYDAHVASMPTTFDMQATAKHKAFALYGEALRQANSLFDHDVMKEITRNAAGSPTFRLYKDLQVANDITVGSGLVKPADFDTDLLSILEPACFIGTPVIKRRDHTHIPGLEPLAGLMEFMNPNLDNTVFIHGGKWQAVHVDPPGLKPNSIYGRSFNQEMLNAGKHLDIQPDDFVFLRPSTSESVFLQFGDIAVYQGGKIIDHWPVFDASA